MELLEKDKIGVKERKERVDKIKEQNYIDAHMKMQEKEFEKFKDVEEQNEKTKEFQKFHERRDNMRQSYLEKLKSRHEILQKICNVFCIFNFSD